MLLTQPSAGFDPVLDGVVSPALDRLATRLGSIPGLSAAERAAVTAGAADQLYATSRRLLTRCWSWS